MFVNFLTSQSPLKNNENVTANPTLKKNFIKETSAFISKMLGKPSNVSYNLKFCFIFKCLLVYDITLILI